MLSVGDYYETDTVSGVTESVSYADIYENKGDEDEDTCVYCDIGEVSDAEHEHTLGRNLNEVEEHCTYNKY